VTVRASANGRVNLIGEHTDYNGGFVLPMLIPLRTTVMIRPSRDRIVTLRTDLAGMDPIAASLDDPRARGLWSDYIVGVADALMRRGLKLGGFDAHVASDIPAGAGLASSAALLVATARALREAFALELDDREVARIAHEAEYSFVGARVGRMDQLVCSMGHYDEALHIDTRDLTTRRVPLAQLDVDLAVIDSGLPHDHAADGYNTRRAECEEAANRLGVSSLRDIASEADLAALPPVLRRRAKHVVTENARVGSAVAAIKRGDAPALGAILNETHASLRDDYEVSLPAIDGIVAAAQKDGEVYGARLTGGGFGGSVLVLARRGSGRAAALRAIAASGSATAHLIVPLG
jgi:galactokinase